MKKIIVLVIALALLGGVAFAADNQSASYVRMLSREAANDTIDVAYYNPAGTAFLEKGFHVQLNNQTVYLNYEHTSATTTDTYTSENWVPFFPTAFLGYNGGQWAAFFSFVIPAGGGSLAYDDGVAQYADVGINGSMGGSSSTFAFNLGGSYRFGDFISIAGLGTVYYATATSDVEITDHAAIDANGPDFYVGKVDASASGTGFGGAFGINVLPIDHLTIGLTVETAYKMELEYDEVEGDALTVALLGNLAGISEGATYDDDHPWRLRFGMAYDFPFGLEIPVSFKLDFWKGVDSNYRNSWSTSMAFRYRMLDDALEVSVGGSYDIDQVEDTDDYDAMNPELSSFTIAGGIGWEIVENLKLDIGALYPIYFSEESTANTDMSKQVINMAIGLGYQF